ncbi:hypothetical protein PROSTU_04624 [Providencia stuartii ATCC 25827]|uniref:Uncharacterized protein n=1 Tax=Providencia stuartii ATCC 25827 TaxID=471874 RepID=A0AA86YE31_PROST|nr:hypothetical protein PROSTU_04624 [Providencia stuartii ATCC 25827]
MLSLSAVGNMPICFLATIGGLVKWACYTTAGFSARFWRE